MKKQLRDNIEIILVEPESPGNIGSCARAMHNMGFHHLGLVNPVEYQVQEAQKMAWNSRVILNNAIVYSDVPAAVSDKGLVIAMTRRKGKDRGVIELLNDFAPEIHQYAAKTKIGLLFGRESRGLENHELQYADRYVQIHTAGEFASLNLAQAVLVTCYELLGSEGVIQDMRPAPSSHEELERAFEHIQEVLTKLGYGSRGSRLLPENIVGSMRKIAGRAILDPREVQMVRGICSAVDRLHELKEKS